ncbi:uncharacterized protein LOC135075992 [Ostrinia nubilalis]|uniref:uncharacterized protein LOC135075992 n=1 Tax=Ostrinia nubilalis TaxID=29057 RepID=UPI0030825019
MQWKVSFITKCYAKDDECITNSTNAAIPVFTAGVPEYGVETLDPVTFETIDSSAPNLKLMLDSITLKGLRNCIATKAHRDDSNSRLLLTIQCNATLDGHYTMSGQLLMLSIEGNGKVHVYLNEASFDVILNVKDVQEKDGKNHWDVRSWSYKYQLIGKSNVRFENLFNGNKILSKAVEAVIADNGNEIISTVGSPVIKTVVVRIINTIRPFFLAVPTENLSFD